MEVYDDRPVSVYDNLSMPATVNTNTAKLKPQTIPTTSSTSASSTAAAATLNGTDPHSPLYTEISFKFSDNNKQHQQQQKQPIIPNGNRSSNHSQQQQIASQVNSPCYATPHKSATNSTTAPALPVANTITANVSPVQRPLSQHSQSELNEASQSIAAVKAALNDAKSKFFGLNGYAQDTTDLNNESQLHKLLPNVNEAYQPKVQIITPSPPPKQQPKYQNIPENSAIFRNQPPELPPKPTEWQANKSNASNSPAFRATTPSPAASSSTSSPSSQMAPHKSSALAASTPLPTPAPPMQQSPKGNLPLSSYKQVPLNDIDSSQPSQAVYMSTTVPQNIKGSKIAGRHTPTRNSLRHSRMLVVNNKTQQGVQHPNPMNFKFPNLARWLLILEILIGLFVTFLSIWVFFLAPNTAIQDNPYWSGLTLLLAGILGLVLVRHQRIKRNKLRENCFIFLRADLYILSLLAVLLCVVAVVCASMHFARLTASDTKCESTHMLIENGSCTCTFNAIDKALSAANTDTNNESAVPEDVENHSYKIEYRELSCEEVRGEWTTILGLSIAANTLGFIIALAFIFLLACYRHNSKRFYASVHTSTF